MEIVKHSTYEKFIVENSSIITELVYDLMMNNLVVRFKNGSAYEYVNVPYAEYEALKTSESVGKTFAQTIKGKYDFLRVG